MKDFLLGITVIGYAGVANAADVKLLLVRDATSDNACEESVYHGRLFAVPATSSLEGLNSAIGLSLLTRTQELPYEDNASGASSIPAGIYTAQVKTEQTKSWMKGNPDRASRVRRLKR